MIKLNINLVLIKFDVKYIKFKSEFQRLIQIEIKKYITESKLKVVNSNFLEFRQLYICLNKHFIRNFQIFDK